MAQGKSYRVNTKPKYSPPGTHRRAPSAVIQQQFVNANSSIFKLLQQSQALERNVNFSGFKRTMKIDEVPGLVGIASSRKSAVNGVDITQNSYTTKMKSGKGIRDLKTTMSYLRNKTSTSGFKFTVESSLESIQD